MKNSLSIELGKKPTGIIQVFRNNFMLIPGRDFYISGTSIIFDTKICTFNYISVYDFGINIVKVHFAGETGGLKLVYKFNMGESNTEIVPTEITCRELIVDDIMAWKTTEKWFFQTFYWEMDTRNVRHSSRR